MSEVGVKAEDRNASVVPRIVYRDCSLILSACLDH